MTVKEQKQQQQKTVLNPLIHMEPVYTSETSKFQWTFFIVQNNSDKGGTKATFKKVNWIDPIQMHILIPHKWSMLH